VSYLIAMGGAFVQQWKTLSSATKLVVGMVANIPMVVAFAWIATKSDRAAVGGYVAIGLFLMTLWNQSQLGVRWSLYAEVWAGTLEFSLISRAPLAILLAGKALAHSLAGMRPAVATLIVALMLTTHAPSVPDPVGLGAAVGVAILGVVAMAFVFAPLRRPIKTAVRPGVVDRKYGKTTGKR
jgi:ABC-type transport system involved in cytochrome c biogenesis permease component